MSYQSATTQALFQKSHSVLPRISVMGHLLVNSTENPVITRILSPGRRVVSFLNAHCVNTAAKDVQYRAALRRSDMILPDGVGVEIAAKMEGKEVTTNLNGTDLTPQLLKEAAQQGLTVFLFGGTPGTAEKAAKAITQQVPSLVIAGTRDGYDGQNGACEAINASGADILLVAMGVPMQELWIDQNASQLAPRICMSVGGLFDFWAGNVSRAPKLVRKAKSEWVWRLLMEPRRMAKRYLIGNIAFLMRAMAYKMGRVTSAGLAKRAMDLGLTLTALAILGPILLLLGLAIRLDSRGPALFAQRRIGKDGKPFTLYKFRSMHIDAEARRGELLNDSDRGGLCFKSRNDPRLTRLGSFLRRYSLDELPQLLNIVKGEMSLVGPRPALPEEVAAYPARATGRLAVKPGLTGLWQVSGRADIGFDQMVEMDLAYANSRSILLDTLLVWLTFRTVLSGRGAY